MSPIRGERLTDIILLLIHLCFVFQVNALDDIGFGQNTILVFASDNGPELEAYDRARSTGHFSMFHFRGLKRDLYEGGHRIPMIVRWPAVVAAGTQSSALFSLTDWSVKRRA